MGNVVSQAPARRDCPTQIRRHVNGKMASSTMASAAAAQPIQIRVLAASTGATYPISLHPNELRCVLLSFLLLLVYFVFCLVLSEQGAHHGSACTT